MRRWSGVTWLLMGLASALAARAAEEALVLPVWPGKAGGDFGDIGPERVRAPEEAPTRNAKWITNVTRPTLHIFRPPAERNSSAAMVVCPGGGYWNLAWDLEGEEVAAWLNRLGMTGIVLKYRVPRRPGQPERLPAPNPLLDAQRAISLVRARAAQWSIDSHRIGIVGFSAGGHLAIAAATRFGQRAYEPIDEIDHVSCRPDFAVAVYPGYLVEQDPAGVEIHPARLADSVHIPADTPPVMLVHASDDAVAGAENSLVMYAGLKTAGVRAEMHLYARGGHGFGVRSSSEPVSTWTDRCADWLRVIDMLSTESKSAQ